MPDIPVSSPLSYVGVFLLFSGFFLVVSGLNIIRVEKITVSPGVKTWGCGTLLLTLGALLLLPEIATSFTVPSAPTPTLALPVSPTNTPTLQTPHSAEPPQATEEHNIDLTDTPTVGPTSTRAAVDVMLCTRLSFDGSKCRSSTTVFPGDTEAVYATWQLSDALTRRAEFTRRWYKEERLLLETSNCAGENTRWTPSDGRSYYVYLSATEGTGKRLFGSESLPAGSYTFELLVDGRLVTTMEFVLQ